MEYTLNGILFRNEKECIDTAQHGCISKKECWVKKGRPKRVHFYRTLEILPGASLVVQWQRTHLPMQETQVWSLGWEDALEKEMATHSSILAWEIPWLEDPRGLLSIIESQRVRHDLATKQQQYCPMVLKNVNSERCWVRNIRELCIFFENLL